MQRSCYDPVADAFLFGKLDFLAVGVGKTLLSTELGDAGAVNGGSQIFPTFGSLSINVNAIPEPSILIMLLTVFPAFVLRRVRTKCMKQV